MALLGAARQAWLAASGSHHEVESSSSSASLLHSIYGSQVSQLPFSDSSETGEKRSQTELTLAARSSKSATNLYRRTSSRPMSSPARVLAAREQQRRTLASTLTEDILMGSQTSLQSGGRSEVAQGGRQGIGLNKRPARPCSAAVSAVRRRPPSASAPQKRVSLSRPKTALGIRRKQSLVLVDLEEEFENGEDIVQAQLIRNTPPVQLTHTPEYFNFWLGKPLQERDFGVKVHKKKPWKRPQSDYGNRLNGRRKSDGQDASGEGGSEEGMLGLEMGLETVLEQDGSGGRRGRGVSGEGDEGDDRGGRGKGDGGSGDGGSGDDGSGDDGSGDGGSGDGGEGSGFQSGLLDNSGKVRMKLADKGSKVQPKSSISLLRSSRKKITWDNKNDFSKEAEEDEYFKMKSSVFLNALDKTAWIDPALLPTVKATRFDLPMDLSTLEGITPLQYLTEHCIVGHQIRERCIKVFKELDRGKRLRLPKKKVEEGLVKVFWSCISREDVESVFDVVLYPEDLEVNVHLFAAVCCVAQRVLHLNYKKEFIETVDFDSLSWKFRDYNITDSLHLLFLKIA